MRFFTRALSGLFLLALTVGLLATAGGLLRGALQDRAAREAPAREAREQIIAAPVTTLAPRTITPILTTFGEISSRRILQVRAVTGGRIVELGDGGGNRRSRQGWAAFVPDRPARGRARPRGAQRRSAGCRSRPDRCQPCGRSGKRRCPKRAGPTRSSPECGRAAARSSGPRYRQHAVGRKPPNWPWPPPTRRCCRDGRQARMRMRGWRRPALNWTAPGSP